MPNWQPRVEARSTIDREDHGEDVAAREFLLPARAVQDFGRVGCGMSEGVRLGDEQVHDVDRTGCGEGHCRME